MTKLCSHTSKTITPHHHIGRIDMFQYPGALGRLSANFMMLQYTVLQVGLDKQDAIETNSPACH